MQGYRDGSVDNQKSKGPNTIVNNGAARRRLTSTASPNARQQRRPNVFLGRTICCRSDRVTGPLSKQGLVRRARLGRVLAELCRAKLQKRPNASPVHRTRGGNQLHMVDCEGGQFKFATGPVVCHIEPQTGLSRLLVHVGVRDDQARKASWNQRGWS